MWKRSNHLKSNVENLETNSNPTELCDSCGEMFNTKESLDNHIKVDHDDAKEKETRIEEEVAMIPLNNGKGQMLSSGLLAHRVGPKCSETEIEIEVEKTDTEIEIEIEKLFAKFS